MTSKRQRAVAKRAGRAKARVRRKGKARRENNKIVRAILHGGRSEFLRDPSFVLYDVSSKYPTCMTNSVESLEGSRKE